MEDIRNKIFNKERFEIDKDRLKILHYESPKRDAKPIKDILPSIIKTLDEPIQDSILILRLHFFIILAPTRHPKPSPHGAKWDPNCFLS